MIDQDPLFDMPTPQRMHFTLSPSTNGYVDLRVSTSTAEPRSPDVVIYVGLTASEALDVMEASVFSLWPVHAPDGSYDELSVAPDDAGSPRGSTTPER